MRKLKIIILLILLSNTYTAISQNFKNKLELFGNLSDTIMFVIGDADLDSIQDTVYYDSKSKSLIFLFSSQYFKPFIMPFDIDENIYQISIDGGLYFDESYTNFNQTFFYTYDISKNDFNLSKYSNESSGSVTNANGDFNYDLTTGEFIANWYYYDCSSDSLVNMPEIIDTIPSYPYYFV